MNYLFLFLLIKLLVGNSNLRFTHFILIICHFFNCVKVYTRFISYSFYIVIYFYLYFLILDDEKNARAVYAQKISKEQEEAILLKLESRNFKQALKALKSTSCSFIPNDIKNDIKIKIAVGRAIHKAKLAVRRRALRSIVLERQIFYKLCGKYRVRVSSLPEWVDEILKGWADYWLAEKYTKASIKEELKKLKKFILICLNDFDHACERIEEIEEIELNEIDFHYKNVYWVLLPEFNSDDEN